MSFYLRIELQTEERREFLINVQWFWTVKNLKVRYRIILPSSHALPSHSSISSPFFLKDELQRVTHIPPSGQELFTVNGHKPLPTTTSLHDLGIDRAGHMLRLSVLSSRTSSSYFVLNACAPLDSIADCAQLLSSVRTGLKRHQAPTKTGVSTGKMS